MFAMLLPDLCVPQFWTIYGACVGRSIGIHESLTLLSSAVDSLALCEEIALEMSAVERVSGPTGGRGHGGAYFVPINSSIVSAKLLPSRIKNRPSP